MLPLTLYIDMDGVVSDFERRFRMEYSFGSGFNRDAFNRFVSRKEFETLGKLQSVSGLLDNIIWLRNANNVSISFLTSAGNHDDVVEVTRQKRFWLDTNGFREFPLICVKHKGYKKDFATPLAVLIDDTLSNVEDFIAAGGKGIHVSSKGSADAVIRAWGMLERSRNVFIHGA